MHFRGSSQQLEAVYPDGHTEVLCRVNWNSHWHITYAFENEAMPLLPKGTVLLVTAWYDNTANNPVNPDPDQWVIFGRRTGDEMSHMWIGTTYLSDEDFEFLKSQHVRPQRANDLLRLGVVALRQEPAIERFLNGRDPTQVKSVPGAGRHVVQS